MERIGRYEILRELGRGGFGRVYLANDPLMKCEVAIKVLSNGDDPEMLARFRDEAAAARKLRHESIVTIYDVGEERGVPYIVMEYLQGMDLQKIREQNVPLSLVEKVRILSQVAAGLQVAHENGIIHRDVKPANIMLLKDGSVKIMDFGIARLNRDGATRHTRTGVLVGTLQYIPPEQFEGHPVDTMADLWAFGVIAFQMFSGRNPFDAAETIQVIHNITTLQIPDLRQINPEVPEDLCQVVRKLLTRDRSARYQTFEDVRVDLNPVLEGLEGQEAHRLVDDARVRAARGELQSAHQIVRQVLEKYPSNTQAKQIRDHIITQIRANEVVKQVAEMLKEGDQDLSAGRYEEAANTYRQAYRLNPGSSTARLKMERAQQMAERARRIRDELNEARTRLSAGDGKEAQRILSGVLADDPDNADAATLMSAAQQENLRQEAAARADAILYARHLAAQKQFAQATEALAACARKVGNHADLQREAEDVRRAQTAANMQARIEAAITAANEQVRKGEYAAASMILAPLAAEFPAHADIREMVKFVAQEEARVRRLSQQMQVVEKPAAPEIPPPSPPPAAKPEPALVIERALEMSRQHERRGQIGDAVHVLDVALSRYPDAAALVNERQRLLTPKPVALEWAPAQTPAAPSQVSAPAPPAPQKADAAKISIADSPAPAPPSHRILWVGVAAAAVLLCGVLGYRLSTKSPPPPQSTEKPFDNPPARQPAATQPPTQAPVVDTTARPESTPGPSVGESSEPVRLPVETKPPVEIPSTKSGPALASLLPPSVEFKYRKGDSSYPNQEVLNVGRSPLRAEVKGATAWLAAKASAGRVVLSLNVGAAASLPPGSYPAIVLVTSNREKGQVQVSLKVEAERTPVKPEPATVTPPPPAHEPEPPKAPVSVAVPAVKKPYSGVKRGQVTWTGSLPAGARLVLGESSVQQGPGAQDGEFPPVDVQVQATFPARGLDIQPQPPTNAQRVVITNSTGDTVSLIRLNWSVK